eukprot:CAMPEP_0172590370 /NCGR_PEP_ID=MMETSP1068-20121228/8861_1 /TAXON_ID=35684 /ORGANISM="Pseudopedinella elastica, Strain CCMP716" /LENGTH=337 /DNA_ID=CAMNT_0013386211 /DNA_START=135 /DNA_END=1148 /DNA_ORIENTATION=-
MGRPPLRPSPSRARRSGAVSFAQLATAAAVFTTLVARSPAAAFQAPPRVGHPPPPGQQRGSRRRPTSLGVGDFIAGGLRALGPRPPKPPQESRDQRQADGIVVDIERPSMNTRLISASVEVARPLEDVWAILTDYDNLATHVPNLVQSRVVNGATAGPGVRLFQEGAQKIVGFDFRASLTMDMREVLEQPGTEAMALQAAEKLEGKLEKLPPQLSRGASRVKLPPPKRSILFELVESQFFSEFDGKWEILQVGKKQTRLFYEVFIRPNGPVPVMALEWRIKEDIPLNLIAVKAATEKLATSLTLTAKAETGNPSMARAEPTVDWEMTETLGLYIKDV